MSERRFARPEDRSAAQLAGWIDKHLGILRGIVDLRELGPDACAAVSAILQIKELRRIAAAWELWDELSRDSGVDTDSLLLDHLPAERVELARNALLRTPHQ